MDKGPDQDTRFSVVLSETAHLSEESSPPVASSSIICTEWVNIGSGFAPCFQLLFGGDKRGQNLATAWYLYAIPIAAVTIYVGAQAYWKMQAQLPKPVGETVFCGGGCGFSFDVASVIPVVFILLIGGIGLFGRAWMRGGFASTDNTDKPNP